jgi:hypothetical protein
VIILCLEGKVKIGKYDAEAREWQGKQKKKTNG